MASTLAETAMSLLRGIASGNADQAIRRVSPDGFVQHDPSLADGVAGLREQARRSARDGHLDVVRILEASSSSTGAFRRWSRHRISGGMTTECSETTSTVSYGKG